MTTTAKQLEALLFATGKPLTHARLVKILGVDVDALTQAIADVREHLSTGSGLALLETETEVALTTAPELSDFIRDELRKDVMGELTKPSVETLAIIAYRGPVTKPEVEQIRGVNCTMILRNLMIRGLIDETHDERKTARYSISMEYLQHLGVDRVEALPDYEELSGHALLEAITKKAQEDYGA